MVVDGRLTILVFSRSSQMRSSMEIRSYPDIVLKVTFLLKHSKSSWTVNKLTNYRPRLVGDAWDYAMRIFYRRLHFKLLS